MLACAKLQLGQCTVLTDLLGCYMQELNTLDYTMLCAKHRHATCNGLLCNSSQESKWHIFNVPIKTQLLAINM